MRSKTLSILSLLLVTWLVAGCSGGAGGGSGAGKNETFTLRDTKVSFVAPPSSWKRAERKTDPTEEGTFEKEQLIAIEFTPPSGESPSPDAKTEDNGFLMVTNLGYSDVKYRADELHAVIDEMKKSGSATQESFNRIVRILDQSGNAGLLEYVDEKTGKISSEKSSELHDELEQAVKLLNVPKGNQPKVKEALPHLEKAAQMCDDGWKKTEIDTVETGPILFGVQKRSGKVTKTEELKVDGQRAAWIEYTVGDERGIHVLFMKDNQLYSIALSVPAKNYDVGSKALKEVVDSFKILGPGGPPTETASPSP